MMIVHQLLSVLCNFNNVLIVWGDLNGLSKSAHSECLTAKFTIALKCCQLDDWHVPAYISGEHFNQTLRVPSYHSWFLLKLPSSATESIDISSQRIFHFERHQHHMVRNLYKIFRANGCGLYMYAMCVIMLFVMCLFPSMSSARSR